MVNVYSTRRNLKTVQGEHDVVRAFAIDGQIVKHDLVLLSGSKRFPSLYRAVPEIWRTSSRIVQELPQSVLVGMPRLNETKIAADFVAGHR